MTTPARSLSFEEARRFYDRWGGFQDLQALYEDAPVRRLLEAGDLAHARSVFEFGCGTGRVARRILAGPSPPDRYLGVDISQTMTRLARARLADWAGRAEVRLIEGGRELSDEEGAFDRFLSTYVFDLLSDEDARRVVEGAWRLLVPGGKACLVSLCPGATAASRLVERAWRRLHALHPALVGGCRPVELRAFLGPPRWRIVFESVVTRFALSSELVVAERI